MVGTLRFAHSTHWQFVTSSRYNRTNHRPYSSLPGLTRQSIISREVLFEMDARVKPAHDEGSKISQ
jgi:hypothetical protein